ncbi:hypothetical protein OKW45_003721 [Paraburkholderia sp. WSM4175]|uniref:hypothetical protein n=1 Tax=Paraburkholderia sp. WSM4175 TaxID=2991072 RepID=UPI003D2362CE
MPKRTIESLRAALSAALLAGEDASAIRADLQVAGRAQSDEAARRARATAEAIAAENAAIQRDARARAEASASRLQILLSTLEA